VGKAQSGRKCSKNAIQRFFAQKRFAPALINSWPHGAKVMIGRFIGRV
jgi:hypothetical protein